ncbi:flagellar protein FlgN [Acuticoccus sp. M5D2P5]|uniref:flagellar protein FlgN n=1 Tax=Acuticoccus kalidii TaxID=2910977 RepID=UPI001F47079F|nr:flagellar protein FlgN [Acuticoccus kalidii]MCF3932495.1 flagellar protein FlgN [Acuticoccus kalidii]
MTQALATSLARLEALVDDCIAALETGGRVDDAGFAEAKGRALLQLSRFGAVPIDALDDALSDQVSRLRHKLAREESLLKVRLQAAELVAELVADAVMADEWDGTYAPHSPIRPPAQERLT